MLTNADQEGKGGPNAEENRGGQADIFLVSWWFFPTQESEAN